MTRTGVTEGDTGKNDWQGRWCWPQKHEARPWNLYVYFRRAIELPSTPQRAVVRISADSRYTLFVNGHRVHFGPARSFQQFQCFDTLDLTPYLTSGRNTICAIVHQFGVPTFQSVFRDASGFLLDGQIETAAEPVALHTPIDWLCRYAHGWRRDVDRRTIQLGFQEHFDAGADPADWMSVDYDPTEETGWKSPSISLPVGSHPWLSMQDRDVPLLADHIEEFARVVAQFTGENARGSRTVENLVDLLKREKRQKKSDLIDEPEAMLRDDDSTTTIRPPQDGHFVAVVFDTGAYRTGHIMLEITDAAGDEDVDILYSEDLDKQQFPQFFHPVADRYRTRKGPQTWESFHFNGMRYVAMIFRHVESPLRIRRAAVRQVHAAVEDVGAFECSDERLNAIWKMCRETQRNCLLDAFVDCPWREQAMWWGDARVQAKVTAYAFGDSSILERGIRLIAQSQAADGSLHAHAPSDCPQHRLPDFMCTWVSSIWDAYQHTGRAELLRDCLPTMHRLFEFFRSHEVTEGLIGGFDGWWVFLDWADLFRKDVSATLNLIYLQALRHAILICGTAGDEAGAGRYRDAAAAVTQSIEKHFWDAEANRFRDGFDLAEGTPCDIISQHANALAILLDLKPDVHTKIAREALLKPARARRSDIRTGDG